MPRLLGLRFFKPLRGVLGSLRGEAAHPNRKLHYDEYLTLFLLAAFNPAITSLRGLVAASDAPKAQRNLGLHHTALGSLSEASRVFDPEPLRRIFLELAQQAAACDAAPRPRGVPADLRLLAADATLWKLLPRMMRECFTGKLTRARKGEFKAHFIFNVLSGVPEDVTFTPGTRDERHVLREQLEPGALYVMDRGYVDYGLYARIVASGSHFVTRLRDNCKFKILENRPLTAEGQAHGVTADYIVEVASEAHPAPQKLRVVMARRMRPAPHNLHPKQHRGKYQAYAPEESEQEWVLITDRLDWDAGLVVQIYGYRWQIEIFFRWFKCVLGMQHLFCESHEGLQLQMYAALIASLLIVIYTGRKPNKRVLEVLQFYFMGWTNLRQVRETIAKLPPVKM